MNKKVLMLAYTVYSIDARIRREAETLLAHGCRVGIIVPREGEKPRDYYLDGVRVRELDIAKYQGKSNRRYLLSYILFTLAASWSCLRLLLKGELDVLHVHNMPNFLIFAGLIPRLAGKKTILDIHDTMPETYATKFSGSHPFLIRLLCWEEAVCCRLANKLICVNHPQRDVLVERGVRADKITILLNVPDHKRFKPVQPQTPSEPDSESLDPRSFSLVYHGTQAKRLGVDFIIRAVALLAAEIPGIRFFNYGDGDDLDDFTRLGHELGIDEHLWFSGGNVPMEELPEILSRMHIGIIANRSNPATDLMLPVKMLEYIALDIPVVVPKLKTIRYYFDETMVSWFEPENVESLASAILDLSRNPEKMKSQAGKAREFLDRYGWEKHQVDLIDLYNNL